MTNGNAECGKPRLNNRISSLAAKIMPTGPERDPSLCILNTLRALLLSLTLSLHLKDTLGLTFTWCYTHSESRCSNTLPSIVIWHSTEIHNSFYLKVFHKNIMVILWYISIQNTVILYLYIDYLYINILSLLLIVHICSLFSFIMSLSKNKLSDYICIKLHIRIAYINNIKFKIFLFSVLVWKGKCSFWY